VSRRTGVNGQQMDGQRMSDGQPENMMPSAFYCWPKHKNSKHQHLPCNHRRHDP